MTLLTLTYVWTIRLSCLAMSNLCNRFRPQARAFRSGQPSVFASYVNTSHAISHVRHPGSMMARQPNLNVLSYALLPRKLNLKVLSYALSRAVLLSL